MISIPTRFDTRPIDKNGDATTPPPPPTPSESSVTAPPLARCNSISLSRGVTLLRAGTLSENVLVQQREILNIALPTSSDESMRTPPTSSIDSSSSDYLVLTTPPELLRSVDWSSVTTPSSEPTLPPNHHHSPHVTTPDLPLFRPPPPPTNARRTPLPPTMQEDVLMRNSRIMQLVALGDSSLGRMLLALRLVLGLVSDTLRPGSTLEETPLATLGTHHLSRRLLGSRVEDVSNPPGIRVPPVPGASTMSSAPPSPPPATTTTTVAHWQEMAFYDEHVSKYQGPYAPGTELATWTLDLEPRARVTVAHRADSSLLLSRRKGPAARYQVDFHAEGSLRIVAHDEEYVFHLPALWLDRNQVASGQAHVAWRGAVHVACRATGLTCVLHFGAKCRVKGQIQRLTGLAGAETVAMLEGHWDGTVLAHPPPPSFKTSSPALLTSPCLVHNAIALVGPHVPPITRTVQLCSTSPRHLPLLWTVIFDALASIEPARNVSLLHAAAAQLRHDLATLSLHHAVAPNQLTLRQQQRRTSSGGMGKRAGSFLSLTSLDAGGDADEASSVSSENGARRAARHAEDADDDLDLDQIEQEAAKGSKSVFDDMEQLLPAIKKEKCDGKRLWYGLQCRLVMHRQEDERDVLRKMYRFVPEGGGKEAPMISRMIRGLPPI